MAVIYKGVEYPSNYDIDPKYYHQEPQEFEIIGRALLTLLVNHEPTEFNQILVWSQGMIVGMSEERYKAKRP